MKVHNARVSTIYGVIAALLLFVSITSAFGQQRSQDRDNPTFVDSNEVTDKLDGSGDEYFYKFIMGAGELGVSFKVTASGTNAGATLDLFDASSSRPLLSNVLAQGVDGGTGEVHRTVKLGARRNVIIMRIKGIRYGDSGGNGTYDVALEGNPAPAETERDKRDDAPKGPGPLTGELDGTESSQSHTLTITGPGKVTLTFDVKASGTNAGAYFNVIDGNSRLILSDVLVQGVDSGSERVSKSLNFANRQTITVRVKGISYGSSGGQGVYSVQVSGPAVLDKR